MTDHTKEVFTRIGSIAAVASAATVIAGIVGASVILAAAGTASLGFAAMLMALGVLSKSGSNQSEVTKTDSESKLTAGAS